MRCRKRKRIEGKERGEEKKYLVLPRGRAVEGATAGSCLPSVNRLRSPPASAIVHID